MFETFSPDQNTYLLKIRQLIFDTQKELAPNELLNENLKWNQPTYTAKNGTAIRLDQFGPDKIAIFFHCQTTLVEQFRKIFADTLDFTKNRSIIFPTTEDLPMDELKICIQIGLTYRQKAVSSRLNHF
ncbi:DUF1801 domain-containing protein [uncultured Vagococcus sp.]|uniref:DUF1801 domain-containing protein n=1 Tax=uncultured Vagococcus sp. TaxID=189676 RepID=UPI0028CFE76A|nr:DUF1801 domain-containing protein [uncultured Vagococcus sp.]